jgi:hypothetical protein
LMAYSTRKWSGAHMRYRRGRGCAVTGTKIR